MVKPASATATRPASVSPARWAAFEVLSALGAGADTHSDDLLHGRALRGLSDADRNLTTALVMGVLRWQIALDAEWRRLLSRPGEELHAAAEIALRLGVFQLRHMERIPAHAALMESVEIAKAGGAGFAAGMVNAILRKISTNKPPAPRLVERAAEFAERLGHPTWLVGRWVERYGRAAAVLICEADQQEPRAGEVFAEPLVSAGGEPLRIDDGSRLVAELAAAAAPERSERAWDMCAAPGGKTIVLASRLPQAQLLATDVSPSRTKFLRERLEGWGAAVAVEQADATAAEAEGRYDLVLCDAPCSGTGTLARNPEIRLRLEPAELSRQARRQRALLTSALRSLRPGGRCVYSTCSLEPEENEAVVDAVLAELPEGRYARVELTPLLERAREVSGMGVAPEELVRWQRDGALRTLPGANFAGDGFGAVVIERAG